MYFSRRLFAGPLPQNPKEKSDAQPEFTIPGDHPLSHHWPIPPYRTGPTITANSPVTPFGARAFGGWNLLSAVIRLYAAYHVDNREVFQLVIWSYVISTIFVCSEVWVYDTARWKSGWITIVAVGVPSMIWCTWGFLTGRYGQG